MKKSLQILKFLRQNPLRSKNKEFPKKGNKHDCLFACYVDCTKCNKLEKKSLAQKSSQWVSTQQWFRKGSCYAIAKKQKRFLIVQRWESTRVVRLSSSWENSLKHLQPFKKSAAFHSFKGWMVSSVFGESFTLFVFHLLTKNLCRCDLFLMPEHKKSWNS